MSLSNSRELREVFTLTKNRFAREGYYGKAYFKGGLPGAGKSTVLDFGVEDLITVIDPDEIRAGLPEYKKLSKENPKIASAATQKDAGLLASMLRNYCLENNLSYLLDSSLSSPNNVHVELKKASEKKYDIEVKYLIIDENVSIQSCFDRYVKQLEDNLPPRFVNPDYIRDRAGQIGNAIKACLEYTDNIVLYDRDMNELLNLNDCDIPENIKHFQIDSLLEDVKNEFYNNTLNNEFLNKWDEIIGKLKKYGDTDIAEAAIKEKEMLENLAFNVNRVPKF